jgi:hypothetical protein
MLQTPVFQDDQKLSRHVQGKISLCRVISVREDESRDRSVIRIYKSLYKCILIIRYILHYNIFTDELLV